MNPESNNLFSHKLHDVLNMPPHSNVKYGKDVSIGMDYSGPPLIRTPLLPNNSVLIREVSFGEREHYIHS